MVTAYIVMAYIVMAYNSYGGTKVCMLGHLKPIIVMTYNSFGL